MSKKPILFITSGFPVSGKSTVASIIAKKFRIKIFTTDKIWREKEFKAEAMQHHKSKTFFSPSLRRRFYRKLMAYGQKELLAGRSVVLDGTFSTKWMIELAKNLARKNQIKLVPIRVELDKISPQEIIKRGDKRKKKDKQAADAKLYWKYKNKAKSLPKDFIIINNDGNLADLKKQVNKIIAKIK